MDILRDGHKIFIKKLEEQDREAYHDLYYTCSSFKSVFNEALFENLWREANSEDMFVCSIIEKANNIICGFCQLDKVRTKTPKLGIDILESFWGRGYAQEAMKLLIEYASLNENFDYFIWEADKANAASRHIAEKLGGVLTEERTYLPQKIIEFGLTNGILSEEDITYICSYRIEKI